MLYYLFNYLQEKFNLAGAGLFQYITFRALAAASLSVLIGMFFGKRIIQWLQKLQIGETIRDLGLEGQMQKKGTPTMGGVIIILSILVPVLLFARVMNVYIVLLIISTLWTGLIGFLDDYIKVFKKNKDGLSGKFKIVGQVGLGLIVGLSLYFNDNVVVRDFDKKVTPENALQVLKNQEYTDHRSTITTVPFMKGNEFDYSDFIPFLPDNMTWIVYVLIATFIITAVSNGANITDGLDGLAAGTSAITGSVLAVFAYVSGNVILSNYLDVMFIPNSGELVVFCLAFVGACIGFLWYNSYPAQVFMGDTGSLCLGGIIAVLALSLRKEFLIPIMCGVFLIENLSVMLQVGYFKYTKKRFGEGRRVLKMAPLHHHYQKSNIPEAKIVSRFWIVGILLAIVTIATLKIR